MRRLYLLFIFIFITSALGYTMLYNAPDFKISQHSSFDVLTFPKSVIFSNDTSLLIDSKESISSLSINGKAILENKDAIIRVILIDQIGREYLVYEDMYLFFDEKDHVFSNMAMETAILENICPKEIKIFIRDAKLELSSIIGVPLDDSKTKQELNRLRKELLARQEDYYIAEWNKYNAKEGQYWLAGKTFMSGLSYSERKKMFGAMSDHYLSDGFEYYIGGLFVVKSHGKVDPINNDALQISKEKRDAHSAYVESFDWRNRHGKNWMTSVKHQSQPNNWVSGNGGCWIFGAVAALESHVNLYYNRLLDLDLSEQEVGSCVIADAYGYPSLHSGGYPIDTYDYISNNGIVNEDCFPFQNDSTIPCAEKCDSPDYVVNISNYSTASNRADILKGELIHNGPIASGIYNHKGIAHVMCLCGYGTIHAGDSLEYLQHTLSDYIDTIISASSPLVGQTYWIYKNSGGTTEHHDGYVYVIYENENDRNYTTTISYPVTISTLTTNDIVCEDADNDGYYFWGLGTKPSNCPICCPDTPDGDDSNAELAEMDTYGNFRPYTFPYQTTIIDENATWNTNQTHCGNIIVTNNATLTISAQLTMNPAAKIIIQNGGTLLVDAGNILNANVDVQASAKFKLLHNGTLYMKQIGNLNVQHGAEADIEFGCILLQ